MDAAMPSLRSAKSSSGSSYPELNTTTSRMALDDIELSPADPNHHEPAIEDVEEALNARNSLRHKATLTDSEVKQVYRWRKTTFALVVLQGGVDEFGDLPIERHGEHAGGVPVVNCHNSHAVLDDDGQQVVGLALVR